MTLADYLAANNLTPEDFARLIGRSVSTVYRLRNGDTKPDATTIAAIFTATSGQVTASDFFHVAEPDLQKGAPSPQPLKSFPASSASKKSCSVASTAKTMTEAEQ